MYRLRAFWIELKARSAGRRAMNSSLGRPIGRTTRDITGPMGTAFSNAYAKLDEHGDAYMRSFDNRIPPSLFVSERDRVRATQPMPMAERCIEDWQPRPGVGPATRDYGPAVVHAEAEAGLADLRRD